MVGGQRLGLVAAELSEDLGLDALDHSLAFVLWDECQGREPAPRHLWAGGLHEINQQLEMIAGR